MQFSYSQRERWAYRFREEQTEEVCVNVYAHVKFLKHNKLKKPRRKQKVQAEGKSLTTRNHSRSNLHRKKSISKFQYPLPSSFFKAVCACKTILSHLLCQEVHVENDLWTNTTLEQNKATNAVGSKDFSYLLYTTLFLYSCHTGPQLFISWTL